MSGISTRVCDAAAAYWRQHIGRNRKQRSIGALQRWRQQRRISNNGSVPQKASLAYGESNIVAATAAYGAMACLRYGEIMKSMAAAAAA